ncbi:M10 family metallopeptidase C-terminal domain-containing protein [Sphingomonas sp. 37zxx]|uniref:M10 family metallopeptidase C-terminal domain-containing protein n=1 Tax=Sphingomonas sp. 37zxx TaxID=1550073 RepID=UPI0006925378|nr:M10 family metallopeptidase C-terminal domain-containing protein [Sphingomonas sp. 37zxx]
MPSSIRVDSDAQLSGTLEPGESADVFLLSVVAGQTYSVALRGAGDDGLVDPLLAVYNAAGALVGFDDDGGAGLTSLFTFTATTTGSYFLTAQAFGAGDFGDYTIDVWAKPAADEVPDTFASAVEIQVGTTFGHIETSNDIDTYKVFLEAGKLYTFELSGGADLNTDPLNIPQGELDTVLGLYAPDGTFIGFNDDIAYPTNISSGFSFLAQESGFYYLDALAYAQQTGGYTLQINEIDVAELDPLDSIDWASANPIPTVLVNGVETAYVYFGDSDENFNQTGDSGGPMVTIDWNAYEKQQVMLALEEYTRILGIEYVITEDSSQATFRLLKTESERYGAYFFPQDPAYGASQGVGVFNVLSGGWSIPGQPSLQEGGYSFAVILHEFGHAHGLAHPHDNGGGSDIMIGVTGSDSLGFFNLNQGVYSVMSYNDAWQLHPDGPTPFARSNIDSGWSGTLSAFDIAVLQARYGVVERETGDNIYVLGDANDQGTFYQTIWDSAGIDEIQYNGARATQIDLTAATLDYSATGGGVVSFVDDIWGGYTIAGGVLIENASGGSGNDVLLGNAANNVLRGNAGNDVLQGREGDDLLIGGEGADLFMVDPIGDSGFDTIADFDSRDVLAVTRAINDGNGDGIITFGDDGILNLERRGDRIAFENFDGDVGLRFLGTQNGMFYYADASVRPDAKRGQRVIEGTVNDDVLVLNSSMTDIVFIDGANAAPGTGKDRVTGFNSNDLIVLTEAINDGNGDGIITTGRDNVFALGNGDTLMITGTNNRAIKSIEFDGSFEVNGVTYYVYSAIGSSVGVGDVGFAG